MRVDLFRRPEDSGRFSYLAVPQGCIIPQEVTNTDWQITHSDIELVVTDPQVTGLGVEDAERQIDDKGYAITSVTNLQ